VYQKLHERLPDNLGRGAVGHHHVHQTVEREKESNFRDDEQLLAGSFSPKTRHTLNEK
jgi:hypothetical protein